MLCAISMDRIKNWGILSYKCDKNCNYMWISIFLGHEGPFIVILHLEVKVKMKVTLKYMMCYVNFNNFYDFVAYCQAVYTL